jgi:hypothetical protein
MSDYVKCEDCGMEKKYYRKYCYSCTLIDNANLSEKLETALQLLRELDAEVEAYGIAEITDGSEWYKKIEEILKEQRSK